MKQHIQPAKINSCFQRGVDICTVIIEGNEKIGDDGYDRQLCSI